ncbi:NAD-P-binding protein [Peniophora sp. CONT]|nr:NAD-P-binding protein [Peniophora sp. CONT]
MPAVPPPAKVLVTGANGYIAAWLVRLLLEDGYSVRGTVRSAAKGAFLQKLFAGFGDKFEIAVVEDITKEGAFDEAVKGVDVVEHTASPFHFKLITPAVQGTTGVLNSIKKNAPNVKRVIVLASCASVLTSTTSPKTYDESSWNEPAVAEAAEKGGKTPLMIAYRASKTLAEKAAWKFVEDNKGSIGWDLTVINPPFVWGPPIHEVTSLSNLNTSMVDLYNTITGKKTAEVLTGPGNAYVDVRDVARAHVLAIQKDDAGGQRIIVSAGSHFWQELVDVANEMDPSLPFKGEAGATKDKPYVIQYDTSRMASVLGLECRPLKDTIKDSITYFNELESAALH